MPRTRKRDVLAEEMGKFSLLYALSEHASAKEGKSRSRISSTLDIAAVKEGILKGNIREGDEVEVEGLVSPYAVVYQPRAYYPAYVTGEMRAALRRGEPPPQASPHYLPVSLLPDLPDGWRISFLYPAGKKEFDRPDFPAHVRDVLTRDYSRMPLLVPPDREEWRGKVRLRARLLRLSRGSMERLAGMSENTYQAYAARGLVHFLEPLEVEEEKAAFLRGSLFAEVSFPADVAWEDIGPRMEEMICAAVAEIFPACGRGQREEGGYCLPRSGHHLFRFRSRLLALVYNPVIVVYRAPRLLGIYLPQDLEGRRDPGRFRFQELVTKIMETVTGGLRLPSPARVEMAYDNRLPWARERGALRGPDFLRLEEEHPFLGPTLSWLRGD